MFKILPKENWWLTLLILFVLGLTGALYFMEVFGVQKGLIYSGTVFLIVYIVTSQAKLLPFITDESLYAHTIYMAVAALWIVAMAISQAFTYRMSLMLRTVFTFVIILLIHFFLIPIIALFSRYQTGNLEYFHYVIQLSGYLVISGYIIIFYMLLLIFEMMWLVNYSDEWQSRMVVSFSAIVIIVFVVGIIDGLWLTSIVSVLVLSSIIIVAKSKGRGP